MLKFIIIIVVLILLLGFSLNKIKTEQFINKINIPCDCTGENPCKSLEDGRCLPKYNCSLKRSRNGICPNKSIECIKSVSCDESLEERHIDSFKDELDDLKDSLEDILEENIDYIKDKAKDVGCDSDDEGEGCEDFQNPPNEETLCNKYNKYNSRFNFFFNCKIIPKVDKFVDNINNTIETNKKEKESHNKNIKTARNSRKV